MLILKLWWYYTNYSLISILRRILRRITNISRIRGCLSWRGRSLTWWFHLSCHLMFSLSRSLRVASSQRARWTWGWILLNQFTICLSSLPNLRTLHSYTVWFRFWRIMVRISGLLIWIEIFGIVNININLNTLVFGALILNLLAPFLIKEIVTLNLIISHGISLFDIIQICPQFIFLSLT